MGAPRNSPDAIALVTAAANVSSDVRKLSDPELEMMLVGAKGLAAALAESGFAGDSELLDNLAAEARRRDLEAARRAFANLDRDMFEDIGGIEVLDDLLAFLIDGMRQDISTMTSAELERVTAESGGRTIAMTYRSLAAAELEWRLTGG